MANADDYAQWIVANQDKKGTPEFNTVAQAYQEAKSEGSMPNPATQTPASGPATPRQQILASTGGRMVQGMRDPIDEAAALLPKGLQAVTSLGGYAPNPISEFLGSEASRVQGINKANEADYKAAKQATGFEGADVARFTGNVLSPANLAVASKLPMALRGVQAVKAGAGVGAIGGALTPSGDVNDENYWMNKAKEVGKGAAFGAGTSGLLAGAARMVRPETNPMAAQLMKEGVTPTPGQILGGAYNTVEEKLQSLPILGDAISYSKRKTQEEFNKAALNRALEPIGEKVTQAGRAGVLEVKEKLGKAYESLLPKISFKPDQQFVQEFGNLKQMATSLPEKEQKTFNSIIDDVMGQASPNGSMLGTTFKTVESKLTKEIKDFSKSNDAYQQKLSDALQEALRIMRDTLPRVNPGFSDELKAINTGYANYTRIRQAASSTAAGAKEGMFTPAQLAQAVRAQDASAGKGASATGQALMQDLAERGTNILSSKVPDSGTTGRAALAGGGAVAGATGTAIPLAAALTASTLPYLGRKTAAAALTKRPESAKKLAELIRKSSPYIAGAANPALSDKGQ
jgi:hypothetical protein